MCIAELLERMYMYKKFIAIMLMLLSIVPTKLGLAQTNTTVSQTSVIQAMTLGADGIQIKADMTRLVKSSTLRVAVWSTENGQDDLHWYAANANGNMVVPFNNHKGYGNYDIHVYQELNGNMTGLEAKVFTMPKPSADAVIERLSDSSVTLTVRNVPTYIESVAVPVWSDEKGQDDIVWYTANKVGQGQFKLVIDAKNHNYTTGQYHVHLYGTSRLNNGQITHLLNTEGFTIRNIPTKTGFITVGDLENAQFSVPVEITQVYHREGIQSVRIAVWSDRNGQDDIVWYIATKQSDGKYYLNVPLSKHSLVSDVFHFHVYYQLPNDHMVFLGSQQPHVTFPQTVKTDVKLADNGLTLQVDPRLVKSGAVLVAIWSEINGQDDLRWYQVDSTATLNVSFGNHSGYGKYHIHIYQNISGQMNGIETREFDFPKPTATTVIQRHNSTTFTVNISNVPSYIDKVLVPIWSEVNGQDDLVWYTATRTSPTSFTLSVDVINHLLNEGQYHVHLYGTSRLENDKLVHLDNTKGFVANNLPQQSGTVKVGNFNNANFSLPIQLSQVAHRSGLKSVKVAVWTNQNGQDDIVWYTANRQSNSEYFVNVPVTNHGILSDTYHMHTYYELNNGSMLFIDAQDRYITMPLISKLAASIEGLGGYSPSIDIRNRLANEITFIHNQGYKTGFTIYDVKTKKGIAYNRNERFYAASTIKGPYVASLTEQNPNSKSDYYTTIRGVLTYSSNEGYHLLRNVYGPGYLMNWVSQAGLEQSIAQIWYPYISANELAKLWERSYQFFTSGPNGNQVGQWFENPNLSPIYKALPHKTKSKAGWIGEPGYHAANDAGIVHSPHGDYIIAITSNADGKLSLLEGVIRILDDVYRDMQTR